MMQANEKKLQIAVDDDGLNVLDNAVVKIDSVTLEYDKVFSKLSKKEMDLAAALFCLFNKKEFQELYSKRKRQFEEIARANGVNTKMSDHGVIVSHYGLKKVAGLSGNNRITAKAYATYLNKLKEFLFSARYPIQTLITGEGGTSHKIVTYVTVFGNIMDVDNGESLVIPITDEAVHVFDNFFPGQSFTVFALQKFESLKSTYAKILFLKLILYKNKNGWEASKEDIIRIFGLSTGTRKNPNSPFYNFIKILRKICDEIEDTNVFSNVTPILLKGNLKGHSVIKGIRFVATRKEVATKISVAHRPVVLSVNVWSVTRTTEVNPATNLPIIVEKKEIELRRIKCPKCDGKIACWPDKDNKQYYFCCENSRWWKQKIGEEMPGNGTCDFFASTEPESKSLTKENCGDAYQKIIDWLLDNTGWKNEKYHVEKQNIDGTDQFKYVGDYLTPAMTAHNNQVDKITSQNTDITAPFPIE